MFDVTGVPERRRHPDDRRLRAAWLGMLAYGPEAIAVGACALVLHGVAGLAIRLQPQVALPAGRHLAPRDGMGVRRFDGFGTTRWGGRVIATIDDALVQALPELPRNEAVAVVDSALNRRLIDVGRLERVRSRLRGRRGAAGVDAWWGLVDGRSESPLETEARLTCVDAGMPPDELQVEINDAAGRFVARGDLGWRLRGGRWLLAEVDGKEIHDAPQALYGDRERQNRLLTTGEVDLLRFIRADFRTTLTSTVGAHLARDRSAARRPVADARINAGKRASSTARRLNDPAVATNGGIGTVPGREACTSNRWGG
ncbi:hypothetical protein [Cellulomonas sp. PhB150]|uniref:hypothetical protein n=1 Tax=Cellulomonas sp. PhB150 TaxID=2485188 RepID=UPI0011CE9A04|nr:hypothetical protein [Cellulomonas sp. PhB150]